MESTVAFAASGRFETQSRKRASLLTWLNCSSGLFASPNWDMLDEILATLFLLAMAGLPWLFVLRWWRTTRYSAPQAVLFCLAYLLVRVQWRATLPRRFPLDFGQGGIVVANHRSSVDPFFPQMLLGFPSRWMVAKEYCDHWALRWFLRQCDVIPTRRAGIDTAATKSAIRAAATGRLVGMLPEGRINTTDQVLLPGRPGAILVALKARVPIIPCFIHGSPYGGTAASPLLRTARVRLVVGEPLDLTEYFGREEEPGVVERLALRVLSEVARLGGHPQFRPTLAGRNWNPRVAESPAASSPGAPASSRAPASSPAPASSAAPPSPPSQE